MNGYTVGKPCFGLIGAPSGAPPHLRPSIKALVNGRCSILVSRPEYSIQSAESVSRRSLKRQRTQSLPLACYRTGQETSNIFLTPSVRTIFIEIYSCVHKTFQTRGAF